MFCTSCGREIIDTARFCNYCGRPVQNIAPPSPVYPSLNTQQPYIPTSEQNNGAVWHETAESASYSAADTFSYNASDILSEKLNTNDPDSDTSVSESVISGEAPETEILSQAAAANKTAFSSVFGIRDTAPYPTPGTIPKSGGSISGTYSAPMGGSAINTSVDVTSSTPEKGERKYTLGHILLCLASTAIMAITAGVFAGLYFSVI